MPQPETYKTRAVFVRHAARAHLKELREQRKARRKAVPIVEDCDASANSELGTMSSDFHAEADAVNDGIAAPVLEETPEDPVETIEALSPEANELVQEVDELDDLAIENVAMSELADETSDPAGTDASEIPGAMEDPAEPAPPRAEGPSETAAEAPIAEDGFAADHSDEVSVSDGNDLTALPGAGPGLIWMLNQCGMNTLADLARADPTQLSSELGVVGQILDVEQWIDFAREGNC